MGRKAKGGGIVVGGKRDLKEMVDLGLEACCGVEGNGGGSSWALTLPGRGRGDLEVVKEDMGMEEALAGNEEEFDGVGEGMGIDPLVHMVLSGGEEVWKKLPAFGGGVKAGKLPVVEEFGRRRLRSGRISGVPAVGGECMEVAGRECVHVHGTISGGPTPVPVVVGGVTEGGGQVAGGSVLEAAPAARVLGGGPAGYGVA